jgi:ribose transport system substrate-binding protein
VVEKAHEKGVYIVVLDRGVTKPVFDVYLSNDDESYARQGMEFVCKQLGGKGNVVLIEGLPSVINDLRTKTAKDVAAKYPGIKILDSQPGNWNKEKATAVMENYLAKYKSIDAVYTADDDMLEGALQAYQESGRKDLKIAFGGAAKKEVVKKIMDGDSLVRADATYPPDVVATGVSVAVVGLRGRVYEGFYQKKLPLRMILPSELITKENAKNYYVPTAAF